MDTAAIRRQFAREGYAVVAGGVGEPAVAAAINAFIAIERTVAELTPDCFVMEPDGAIFIAGDPVRFRPELLDIVTDPVIVALTKALLGAEEIRLHFTNLTAKAPASPRSISWHRDYPNQYMCPRSSTFLRVMACLDGMDRDNGATQFVPRSHQLSDEEAIDAEHAAAAAPAPAGVELEVAVCPPGSLVFIHPKVLHGGPPNHSGRPRRNPITQWALADAPVCLYAGAESLTGLTR